MSKKLNLYIVRHGETEFNLARKIQGSCDSPLTEHGISQSKLTYHALQNVEFKAVYSSLQQRAIDTAKYIRGDRDTPFFQHIGLREIGFGSWECQTQSALKEDAEFQRFLFQPELYTGEPNQGESFQTLLSRGTNALNDIVRVHNHGNILLVSHGILIRLLLHVLNGGIWQEHKNPEISPSILNNSISILEVSQSEPTANLSFKLVQRNCVEHLA